jgi:preprotein translocase subunit SecE
MDNVKVPQEWPRRKKVRSIVITVLFIIVVLLISVN